MFVGSYFPGSGGQFCHGATAGGLHEVDEHIAGGDVREVEGELCGGGSVGDADGLLFGVEGEKIFNRGLRRGCRGIGWRRLLSGGRGEAGCLGNGRGWRRSELRLRRRSGLLSVDTAAHED